MASLERIGKLYDYITYDLFGGPRPWKLNWIVNFQKGATLFWVLGLMYWFQHESVQAWVYLALHGSYGFCWLLKDVVFPDAKWQARVTVSSGLVAIVAVLGPYWVIPYILIAGYSSGATIEWLVFAVILHTLGVAIMMTADAQKHFTLKFKKGLISSGMFRSVRHPNYSGEIMVYASYAIVAWHWLPWVILAWVWIGLFAVHIMRKEASMSRYEEWPAYKKRSGYLLPKIF
jgi:protein-S-isoprenylcysteine O-methyltransferase Ste14